jgi:alkanesulfonate monooxygenase SsuD/methylene tetrahydromethanopterin reductase-like flavin-dependent oxidoreductase (luciferase family)
VCAAWGQATSLPTGIAVVGAPRSWKVPSLASQAATVALLSRGGFVLGIGSGGYGPGHWSSLGLPNKPIGIMREYLTATRAMLAGGAVTLDGVAVKLRDAALDRAGLPRVPVYLGALGPQMLRLAGAHGDGALLNWAPPDEIAASRAVVAEGAAAAGRDPAEVKVAMFIRVCVDEDVAAARRAFGEQVLGYAMGRPGVSNDVGYRGVFTRAGFDDILTELEERRDRGTPMAELVDAAPDELYRAVGYFGDGTGAAEAYARLAVGLDETMVRVITARRSTEAAVRVMEAFAPAAVRAAAG